MIAAMGDDTPLSTAVLDFLIDETGVDKSKLTPMTRISHDLGVDGDDAMDLLEKYAIKFHVNMDKFPYSEYFGVEAAFNPLNYIFHLVFRLKNREMKPLTVGDLIEGAKQKILLAN